MTESVWPERHREARNFIEAHSEGNDKVSKTEINKLKAIISTVGQFNFPSDSLLSLIKSKRNGIPDGQFKNSEACNSLVNFLQDVPWED